MNKHTRSVGLIDGHTEEMTDAEVIKALDDIVHIYSKDATTINGTRVVTLFENALDLINRQQAEIERLKREIEDLESIQEISPEAKYLVDTKADKVISLLTELNKSQEEIKSEAIKEFAEMLMDEVGITPVDDFNYAYVIRSEEIDNLVKEMTEKGGAE